MGIRACRKESALAAAARRIDQHRPLRRHAEADCHRPRFAGTGRVPCASDDDDAGGQQDPVLRLEPGPRRTRGSDGAERRRRVDLDAHGRRAAAKLRQFQEMPQPLPPHRSARQGAPLGLCRTHLDRQGEPQVHPRSSRRLHATHRQRGRGEDVARAAAHRWTHL